LVKLFFFAGAAPTGAAREKPTTITRTSTAADSSLFIFPPHIDIRQSLGGLSCGRRIALSVYKPSTRREEFLGILKYI
jgi:hypothetical protein